MKNTLINTPFTLTYKQNSNEICNLTRSHKIHTINGLMCCLYKKRYNV